MCIREFETSAEVQAVGTFQSNKFIKRDVYLRDQLHSDYWIGINTLQSLHQIRRRPGLRYKSAGTFCST